MLTADDRRLVHDVREHAQRWNDDADHTVAAGLLTESGRIILGLNTFHFLGGPCGEIAALSNHASTAPEDPIVSVAAARGAHGEIISPCGKCRQVLFDVSPEIRFIVREPNGLTVRTARELLPFAYDWHAADLPQQIYLWEGYEPTVRSGAKRQTIRVDDPFHAGPAHLVFEKDSPEHDGPDTPGSRVIIDATITSVRSVRRDELTDQDARLDGFESLDELQSALDRHYPGLTVSATVDLVSFELRGAEPRSPEPEPDTAPYPMQESS